MRPVQPKDKKVASIFLFESNRAQYLVEKAPPVHPNVAFAVPFESNISQDPVEKVPPVPPSEATTGATPGIPSNSQTEACEINQPSATTPKGGSSHASFVSLVCPGSKTQQKKGNSPKLRDIQNPFSILSDNTEDSLGTVEPDQSSIFG